MKRVYVILVNYCGWKDTIACVQSLLDSTYCDISVVVCDNCSPDGSAERLVEWARRFSRENSWKTLPVAPDDTRESIGTPGDTLIRITDSKRTVMLMRSTQNGGFSSGCNAGIRVALSDDECGYCWILNNDTIVDSQAIERLVSYLSRDQSLGLCGTTLVRWDHRDILQAQGGAQFNKWTALGHAIGQDEPTSNGLSHLEVERQMSYVIGASMFVSVPFIKEVGLMSEDYFLYYEEIDWSVRARRHHFRLGYCQDAIVVHKIGQSIGSSHRPGERSTLSEYHLMRSKLIFTRKYYPYAMPTVALYSVVQLSVRVLRGHFGKASVMLRALMGWPMGSGCSNRASNDAWNKP